MDGRPGPAPQAPQLPRSALERYGGFALLGHGGMGEVWRARDGRLQRDVALKVLRPQRALQPEAQERLRREMLALSRLRHPSVVRVYDYEREGSAAWYTMELLEGGTLAALLKQSPLPCRRAVELVASLADGVAAVHALGMVHRDIKPGNVMVAPDGMPRLMDFGLVKFLDQETLSSLTRTAGVVGTLRYLPPESFSGDQGSPRSDVYQLGLILHEALARCHPLPDLEAFAAFATAEGAVLPAPDRTGPDHDDRLDAVVRRAVARRPADRHPDAATLRDELLAWLAGPTAPQRPPVAEPAPRRSNAAPLGALLGALAVTAALGFTTWRGGEGRPQAQPGTAAPASIEREASVERGAPGSRLPSLVEAALRGRGARAPAALEVLEEGEALLDDVLRRGGTATAEPSLARALALLAPTPAGLALEAAVAARTGNPDRCRDLLREALAALRRPWADGTAQAAARALTTDPALATGPALAGWLTLDGELLARLGHALEPLAATDARGAWRELDEACAEGIRTLVSLPPPAFADGWTVAWRAATTLVRARLLLATGDSEARPAVEELLAAAALLQLNPALPSAARPQLAAAWNGLFARARTAFGRLPEGPSPNDFDVEGAVRKALVRAGRDLERATKSTAAFELQAVSQVPGARTHSLEAVRSFRSAYWTYAALLGSPWAGREERVRFLEAAYPAYDLRQGRSPRGVLLTRHWLGPPYEGDEPAWLAIAVLRQESLAQAAGDGAPVGELRERLLESARCWQRLLGDARRSVLADWRALARRDLPPNAPEGLAPGR